MSETRQQICLIGIGTGGAASLTAEAAEAIRESDCVIGAKRMVESVGLDGIGREVCCAYQPEEIKKVIAGHPRCRKIAVLYSGDIGFYSGAKELCRSLGKDYDVRGIPGISSVMYLAARLKVSWEDARLISIHGRRQPYIHILARHKKTFLLFGGNGLEEEFCQRLREYGMGSLKIWIGCALSYEEERITCRTGADIRPEDLSGLVVLYVENPSPLPFGRGQIRDDAFIRGNVPMTKEEIRAVSIAKLDLCDNFVLYDVGAGTGSVAVTAAALYENARVYAVEQNKEGIELIRKNKVRFCTDQVDIVWGMAPEALDGLEPPTRVFIGGTSGHLEEILRCIAKKSPHVRTVLNVITLETLREVLEAEEKGLLTDVEITQVSVARARRVADYHMMTGQNPVYIISGRAG